MKFGIQKFAPLMNEAGDLSGGGEGTANPVVMSGDPNETFDDLDYESDASKDLGKKFEERFKDRIERAKNAKAEVEDKKTEKTAKADKKEEVKEAKKGNELDLLDMDEKEEKDDEKEKPEKKADKKTEPKEDEDKELEEDKSEAAKEAKKLKIRMSDGLYGIESDAKVRVKIDGEFQEVPVQELINQYSGKVAYDKKFSEIGNEKKQIETIKHTVEKQQQFLKTVVAEVSGHLDDPEKNPVDALMFLVEKSGRDPYDVWKRTLEANLEEVDKLMSMSEVERKAYFLEKKDEFRTKSEEARKAESAKETAFNQALQKVDSLRQAHGVSEEQYLQALDELESQGIDTLKMTDEQVVDYASLKPHVETVQDVLEPFEDSLDDSKYSEVVRNLARQLRAKDFTKEQLAEWAKKEFLDEDVKDLQARTQTVQKKTAKVEVKAPTKLATLDFDDED
jgi:hypothetical protein